MHGVSSLSLPFVKNDADIGHKSANKVSDMLGSFNLHPQTCRVKRGVSKKYVFLPAIKFSQLLLQKDGLERQTNTSSTEQHCKSKLRQLRAQMTPSKESEA